MNESSTSKDQTPTTFEAGARKMDASLHSGDVSAYFANGADPLHAAFAAKAAIHSGPAGIPLMGQEAEKKLKELWDKPRTGKGLAYFHIPFCETRCLYCMFYQNPFSQEASHAFSQRLIKEIELWSKKKAQTSGLIHAVYFGGGTPTCLAPADLTLVLKAVKNCLPLANDCEITLEGRIHHFEDEKMEAALKGGVNRFSLGIQSFNSHVRQQVQRVDGRDAIISRLKKLCSFDDAAVVIDLIYGFPDQTMEVWEDDLRTAIDLPLDGIDCYQLNVFEKSPLAKYIAHGKVSPAADTAAKADMFAKSVEILTRAQWKRISNNHWRQTNRERNIYNELGKSACDCLAFGCGAGGRLDGYSFMMERKLSVWTQAVEAGRKPVMMLMAPRPYWHMLRTISSQMELGEINLARLAKQFNQPIDQIANDVIDQWIAAGLLQRVDDWLVQTIAGQFWHVTMAQLLVDIIVERLPGAKVKQPSMDAMMRHIPAGMKGLAPTTHHGIVMPGKEK